MVTCRTTEADLQWWWQFAAEQEWTFARTYARTAPHDYIVQDRTPGVTHEDVVRAARVIATFGVPGKYYSRTKLYLTSPDGQYRWWTEDTHFTDATLVNRASTDRWYGIQNAPSTVSGIDTPWNEVATSWDEENPMTKEKVHAARKLLSPFRGPFPPHALDLGCGTGRVRDAGLVTADNYAALDSSQAMLNVLVRKHPGVAAVYPMDARQAIDSGLFTPGQFDWVFVDGAVELSHEQRDRVRAMARRALIRIDADEWTVTPTDSETSASDA